MQSKRKFVLSCLIALSACSAVVVGGSVMASDWVEEEGVSDFQAPRRTRNIPVEQNPDAEEHRGQQRSHRFTDESESDEAPNAQVEDSGGGHGIPAPKKKNANMLEGNVSHFHSGTQNQSTGAPPRFGLIQQEPTSVHYPPAREAIVESKTFRSWIEKNHPELQGGLQAQREQIIEVKGKWDDSGHVLRAFGLGCSKVPPDQLHKYDLSKSKILIVDCAGNVPAEGIAAITKFVRGGGYLLTTDWALEGCLQKAVPGFIEWNGDNTSETRVVDAYIKTEDPILTQGTVPRAHWKLDRKCQLMRVIKPDRVEILAASVQLKTDDTQGLGNLAATFNFGKGKVLHLVGHFDYNSGRAFNNLLPDPAPKIGISLRQAIAANFIAEALGQSESTPAAAKEN
ncbi:MAG: hypothetical protein DKT66_04690 [Candidatus Melainabacteria bacterium]|nr:MAG: hypothetical protein DKT66_04690 [Candidatus Melainabacteria bacterium]